MLFKGTKGRQATLAQQEARHRDRCQQPQTWVVNMYSHRPYQHSQHAQD